MAPARETSLYLVSITLGCMKCATGIQPSPHNSPIYDWAKLLSMRRIKSRARVQEKSAGRATQTALPLPLFSSLIRRAFAAHAESERCRRARQRARQRARRQRERRATRRLFSLGFFSRSRVSEIREELNTARRGSRAHVALRYAIVRPIAFAYRLHCRTAGAI